MGEQLRFGATDAPLGATLSHSVASGG